MSAGMELDPLFVRALKLLHSKSKDSTAQLKSLLDEAIKHRKGLVSSGVAAPRSPKLTRIDADKKNLDRLKNELADLVPGAKRQRLGSPVRSSTGFSSSKSHTPSPTPISAAAAANESSPETNSADLTLEGLNDCTCCVCKSFNQENGNKLMECHSCQNLFHRECHVPIVSNEDANDPRLIWNCSDCVKQLRRKSSPSKHPTGAQTLAASLSGSMKHASRKLSMLIDSIDRSHF